MKPINYDHQFNLNEWYVLATLCAGLIVIFVLPRRFPMKQSILFFTLGVMSGAFFDLTVGILPVSYYDVGDSTTYQFTDFISLLVYGPFSYLFMYVLDALKLRAKWLPLYILVWSCVSLGMERIGVQVGEYHYDNGYTTHVSVLIYLSVLTLWAWFYTFIKSQERT